MNKTLSLMGLARKAGKLGIGHDVVFAAVRNGTAKAVILTSDASPRHARELEAAGFSGRVIVTDADMDEAGRALGKRSCIFSVDDSGFAKAIEKTV
ncbi:MAG: ribosomal L7Ae/L30e/S12e/Gadd45 family protein [Oscillospiraceae bacterium]|nr:ribosomal L7Ae/L30e/S12e/Gadd45 family protein [Oscillospiraceae bacterium]